MQLSLKKNEIMHRQILLLVIVLLGIYSCNRKSDKENFSANGTWKSVGSGWVLQIKDSTNYSFFDITSISCLPGRKGKFEELQNALTLRNDTLELKKGVITYKFTKNNLPDLCHDITEHNNGDPLYNFEVFAKTVKENYAFFELNNINWNQLYKTQKQKLTENPSDVKLYRIIEETLEILNDNHAFIEATDEVYETIEKQSAQIEDIDSEALPEYGDFQVAQKVAEHNMQLKILVMWTPM